MGNNLGNSYETKIKTEQCKEMTLKIEIKNSSLFILCFYYSNYIKNSFSNYFHLEDLQQQSPYYNQFNSEIALLKEITGNKYRGKEYIRGNEVTSLSID